MNKITLQKGLKISKKTLYDYRQFIEDTFKSYVGLRTAESGDGVVMKNASDISFKITIDDAGNWTVAKGFIINHQNEIIHNVIDGLSPASGLEPGGLTGDNPLDHNEGIKQFIIVQTDDKTQEVDHGSIEVVAASNAVLGINTQFTKWFEEGSKFNVANSGLGNNGDKIVLSVANDNNLTTVNNFTANESGLKFSVLGTFFSGYPSGGNKNLHSYNSFTFRTTVDDPPSLADGEYLLAECNYASVWTATDKRSDNLFTLPLIRTAELENLSVTLAKMALDSVDENKIVSTSLGTGMEGGSGSKINVKSKQQIVTVAKSGGDYTTYAAARASISDAASDKIYTVLVFPGEYDEAAILKNWVNIVFVDPKATKFLKQVSDDNVECNCYLKITIESAVGYGLYVRHTNSLIIVDGDVSSSVNKGVNCLYGTVTINGNVIATAESSSGGAHCADGGALTINGNVICANASGYGVSTSGGGTQLTVNGNITGISIGADCQEGTLTVNGDVISSTSYALANAGSGIIIAKNGMLKTEYDNANGHACNQNGGNFTLQNVKIICTHADAKSIWAPGAKDVRCMSVWANRDDHANITQLIADGFHFDADVQ